MDKKFCEYILEVTIPDEITGNLLCKKCKNPVRVDWFEQILECSGCDEL